MLARHILVLSAAAATAAVTFYFLPERSRERFSQLEVPVAQLEPAPEGGVEPASDPVFDNSRSSSDAASSTRRPADSTDVRGIEARWHTLPEASRRIELASELAGENDAESVRAIGRLLAVERHPEVKRALLSALTEIDPFIAVEERLEIIQGALRSESPQLRAIALSALEHLEDPRVMPLLRRLSREDADATMRGVAAKMIEARTAIDNALSADQGSK